MLTWSLQYQNDSDKKLAYSVAGVYIRLNEKRKNFRFYVHNNYLYYFR